MTVGVALSDRYQGDSGPHDVEELRRAAGDAAVMSDLQHVRSKLVAGVLQQPTLLLTLGVSHHQHPYFSDTNDGDRARIVWIGKRRGKRGVRSEEYDRRLIHDERISWMHSPPL